jgi:hypothetical protein
MHGGDKKPAAPVAASMPAPPPVPVQPPAPPPPPAPAVAPPVTAPPEPSCPPGQVRDADSQGHCCWQDQAWSSAHDRCIGKPTCPKGLVVKGETCIEPPTPASTLSPEMFSVSKTGSEVTLVFPAPLVAKQGEQYWAAIVEAGKPDSEWGTWAYVPQAARKMTLKAPTDQGAYEVRLHGNYPTKSYNVVHRVRIRVD